MHLSVKGLALACGLIWGGSIALTGLVHLAFPTYATALLDLAGSIYPGFHGARSFGDVLLGTAWALADGAGGGLIFGWLYNCFCGRGAKANQTV